MMDFQEYVIENDYLKVTITSWGAQVKSVVRKLDGVEHIWQVGLPCAHSLSPHRQGGEQYHPRQGKRLFLRAAWLCTDSGA